VAALLREHWLAGRLSTEELEARMGAALAARDDHQLFTALAGLPMGGGAPAPAAGPQRDGSATASLVLGIISLAALFVSFGLLTILTLPMSATAWGLGRSARRSSQGGESWRSSAQAGEVLGIVGTVLSSVLLAGCAAVIAL
jgi:hypothetical protein